MPETTPFVVGRQTETERFAQLVAGKAPHWLLNIYGPGGIGKTIVGQKMKAYAQQQQIPFAFVDGIRPDLTPDRLLYTIKEGLTASETLADAFADFEREYQEYLIVQEVLQRSGGINSLFDVVGTVKDSAAFTQIITGLGKALAERTQRTLSNRFALERYLRGVEKALTGSLASSLAQVVQQSPLPPTLLLDTYEEMEGLDDWVCRTLSPALPDGMKVVVLGRNALAKVNFDWGEYGTAVHSMELPELTKSEAKAFLAHHGLRDMGALEQVCRFTGGYPLLLVLVVHLAREVGGWQEVGTLESDADRDHVAGKLLERILREERAKEVQAFLEKGVVARWFTPEVVSVVLAISPEEGRAIYDKLKRHSFVERHPYGLKFHDKIRELLLDRLKFNKPEYNQVVKRLRAYYAEKVGVTLEEDDAKLSEAGASKYNIHVHGSSNLVIGDAANVTQDSDAG